MMLLNRPITPLVASRRSSPNLLRSRAGAVLACKQKATASPQEASPAVDVPVSPILSLTFLTPFLLDVQSGLAKDGEFGLLEGRTAALVHPAIMLFLFSATAYAGYLGWQWRRTRETGDEIKVALLCPWA